MKPTCKIALIALCLAFFLPAAWAEIGITNNEIVIATCNALSGQSEFAGRQTNLGIQTYINAVNAEGGIFGRKIKLVNYDDRYEPEEAIKCFQRVLDEGVFGMTGVYS